MSATTSAITNNYIIREKHRKSGQYYYYDKRSLLGKGASAQVYQLVDIKSGGTFAGKIVSKKYVEKSDRRYNNLRNEIQIHRNLSHQGIVGFYRYFTDDKHIYLLTEYCNYKTISHHLKRR